MMGSRLRFPLPGLAAQHAAVADEIAEDWQQVPARTSFIADSRVVVLVVQSSALKMLEHEEVGKACEWPSTS